MCIRDSYYDYILSELRFVHALKLSLSDTADYLDSLAGESSSFYYRCMCVYRYPRIQTGRIEIRLIGILPKKAKALHCTKRQTAVRKHSNANGSFYEMKKKKNPEFRKIQSFSVTLYMAYRSCLQFDSRICC